MRSKIFCAIDTLNLARAGDLARSLGQEIDGIKLGLEFFTAHGAPGIIRTTGMMGSGSRLFLDLKLHDIPNTVAGAVRAAVRLHPHFLTIHASGGSVMMKAAVAAAYDKAADLATEPPKLLAVTVLTNFDERDLAGVGQAGPVQDQVLRLATLAQECGMSGVICSPHEIAKLRQECGADFTLMVPGIRPAGSANDDQKRTMTPQEAVAQGADYLVIGRPITQAADPAQAVRDIIGELEKNAQ